ncbi:hypothetical protein D5F01_LYC15454 [Larimichthys crocea]|uniref:Uncharacterized protein n=1 Tax=Larimichthys crocea TaxID=215358 RepID=A0A6G0I3K6_LARCR|nr:hypothetical protein D5F01_LYC15454 [Larimichthys crocea]
MLEAQHIPNAIVYSRLQLPKEEEMTLLVNFADEGNIVLLCLEDMTYSIPPSSYSKYYSTTFDLSDHLRLAVINHAPAVLKELRRKALCEHKDQYVRFWTVTAGTQSWNMSDEVDISPELMKKITDHSSVFERDWEAITNYIMRDKAYDVATAITRELGRKYNPCVARGENCMLLVAYSSVPLFRTCVSGDSMIVDLHRTITEFYRENHTLIYLQLIPYMKHMSDHTWVWRRIQKRPIASDFLSGVYYWTTGESVTDSVRVVLERNNLCRLTRSEALVVVPGELGLDPTGPAGVPHP